MNATGLLCDAFPLLDNTMNQEEREGLLEKQYHTMITLLTDPCHLVRIKAIKVSGRDCFLSFYFFVYFIICLCVNVCNWA